MYCNGLPEHNIGFLPYVHKILDMLENESLAIEPIQLNLKLDGGREMCERCMKTREEQAEWDKTHKLNGGREMTDHGIDDGIDGPGEEDGPWAEGWDKRSGGTKGGDIVDATEVPREVQSRSLLNYNIGKCPCCIGDLWVQCRSKADIEDYSGVCDTCGYVDSK
jgi:hypothetical protein